MTQALVFTRTKHRANRLADALVQAGIKCERIHGNRSQGQRMAALAGFKNGTYPVLVATDIAARGIDVDQLGHVVNFDVPLVPDDYIHRVGRTGRAEATGDAFTFVAPDEDGSLRDIERAIGRRLPRVTVPDFDYTARPKTQARDSARPAHRGDSRAEARRARAGRVNAARRGAAARRPKPPGGAQRPPQPGGGRPPSGGRPRSLRADVRRSRPAAVLRSMARPGRTARRRMPSTGLAAADLAEAAADAAAGVTVRE